MTAVDLDRESHLDLVVVYGTAGQETSFAVGDPDRSGTLDLATIDHGRSVTLFSQTGCGA